MASAAAPPFTREVFGTPDGRILVTSSGLQYLYAADLKSHREYEIQTLKDPEVRAGVVGEYGEVTTRGFISWKAYRLTPALRLMRAGHGELESISDRYLVACEDSQIRTETLDGRLLGTFPVDHSAMGCRPVVIAFAPDRLYVSDQRDYVADFSGREVLRLRRPPGGGARHGWSADGGRILYDHFMNTPTSPKEFIEMNLPIPKHANGEVIRVVDTETGGICFEWDSPGKLLGMADDYHADLSPSGRLVAAVTNSALSIYQLPDVCSPR